MKQLSVRAIGQGIKVKRARDDLVSCKLVNSENASFRSYLDYVAKFFLYHSNYSFLKYTLPLVHRPAQNC